MNSDKTPSRSSTESPSDRPVELLPFPGDGDRIDPGRGPRRLRLSSTQLVENALGIVGRSPTIRQVRRQIVRLAGLPVCVLIRGETGTGKELVAQSLHRLGPHASAPFIAVNCAAIPEHLLESELFGYRRGTFTGAERDTPGLIERAGQGTVFFDEIGDMSPYHQAKILRVLQEKRVRRIGDDIERPIYCRFIFATHAPLERRVREGRFRKDLYFRIRTPCIRLPALRDRREDIPLLVQFFLRKYRPLLASRVRRVHPRVWDFLLHYPWPGNVRELESVLVTALAEARNDTVLRPEHFPPDVRSGAPGVIPVDEGDNPATWTIQIPRFWPLVKARAAFEQQYAQFVLQEVKFNKSRAARILGVCRETLYHILDGRRGTKFRKASQTGPPPLGPGSGDRTEFLSVDPGSPPPEARTDGGL